MTTGTGPWTTSSRTLTTSGVGNEAGWETEDLKRAKMKMTMDDHQQDINDPRVLGTRLGGTKAKKKTEDEMTTMTDTKVKETIARVQVGDGTMTSDQPRKMIKEIWGEDGRDEKNEDKGAGLSGTVEGGGVGRGEAVKGEGVRRGQDTGDTDGCYSYPLVVPRLEEAPDIDHSTVVQCTGADRSLGQPHNVMDNPLYSQHLEGEEREDTINPRGGVYKGDRSKDDRNKKSDRNEGDRNKNGDRNTDGRFKANDKIKEWPGTRKGAKTRNIRHIPGLVP